MTALPSEILLDIFAPLSKSSLFNVVQVSKLWNSVAIPILWYNPRFGDSRLFPHKVHIFETYGSHIHDVELYGNNFSIEKDLQFVITTCNKIMSLEFRCVRFTMQEMIMLTDHLSGQLESLSINVCYMINETCLLGPYIAKLKKLKKLNLIKLYDWFDFNWNMITTECPLLEELHFRNITIEDTSIILIAQRLRRIRSLTLNKCINVTNKSFVQLAESLPLLETLKIDSINISDFSFIPFIQHHPRLRSLKISFCKGITDSSFITIAMSCFKLESLCIENNKITNSTLSAFALARCRNTITKLKLISCNYITTSGVQEVINQFSNLRCLNIKTCSSLTEDIFKPPLKCTRLIKLSVCGIKIIIRHSLYSHISNITSLVTLDLSIFLNLKDLEEMLEFLSKMPNLKILRLHRLLTNINLNDHIASLIAKNLTLTNLYVDKLCLSKTCINELKSLCPNMHLDQIKTSFSA
jgi:F-box-like